MADGVTFAPGANSTPPANTKAATDDCGGSGHVQIVKLAISADGDATVLPADATNGLDVDVTRLPAGTALLGKVAAGIGTDAIYSGTTALTPKFAFLNVAGAQTDSSLVAAVSSKSIRVLAAAIVCAATATNITFNSKASGSGVAISAAFANAANGGEVLPFSPIGWFQTVSGEALTVTTGSGSSTGVQVVYVEV